MLIDIEYSLKQIWEVDLGIKNVDIVRFLNNHFPKNKSHKWIWGIKLCFWENLGNFWECAESQKEVLYAKERLQRKM